MKPPHRRVAYLTIDDAPSPRMPRKVKYLSDKGIPAIWFCEGNHLEQGSDFAPLAIRKGFLLGNHSFDHPHFSAIKIAGCLEQIERTHWLLESLYLSERIEWSPRYFRFPYGDKGDVRVKKAIQDFLRRMGYVAAPSAEIILIHDHEETSEYFERIVERLLEKGFSFELPAR